MEILCESVDLITYGASPHVIRPECDVTCDLSKLKSCWTIRNLKIKERRVDTAVCLLSPGGTLLHLYNRLFSLSFPFGLSLAEGRLERSHRSNVSWCDCDMSY
uniref:Uncharacterized protein n=1 Tax=Vespula pensylvanica TaxID=30213 RepID=A0A834P1W0_VESPE|nr:hypothetical protein H0235_007736 [Vespula pensylvanica]